MPIPSLSLALKSRTVATKPKDARLPSESSRSTPNEGPFVGDHARSSTRILQPVSNTADGLRRKSFLPQLGDLKYISRKVDQGGATGPQNGDRKASIGSIGSIDGPPESNPSSPSPHVEVQDPKQGRLRPRSMYQASSTRVERKETTPGIPSRLMPPPARVDKPTSAQPAMLNRSASLRKPGASTLPAQPAITRSRTNSTSTAASTLPLQPTITRSRTHSTSTAAAARKPAVEPRTQSERPKSLFIPRSASVRVPSKGPEDVTVSSTGRPTRITALQRSASLRPKPEPKGILNPTSTLSATRSGTDLEPQTHTASSKLREASQTEPKKQNRPAFSTLQQHFTPRKVEKPLMSTFLHPPPPDVGADTIPPEMVSIQVELLQLHLLHQASTQTSKRWELSAKRSLQRKFDEVTSLYSVMREDERHSQEQKNIRALRDWNSDHVSCGFAEHIQILSGPLQELPSLVDSQGRFGLILKDFRQWLALVEDISISRDEDGGRKSIELLSVEGLGDSWKAENAALTRKLTGFSRDLDRLIQPAPGSSIKSIVGTCKELVRGILDELRAMQTIEADIVEREKMWVEEGLKAIARDGGAHLSKEDDCEAWRL